MKYMNSIKYHFEQVGLNMNSRLQTLLEIFGMEDRVYQESYEEDLEKPIDFSRADEILERERDRVKRFLDKAIEEIGGLTPERREEPKHIQISRQEKCCGCTACSRVCPCG